MLEDTGCRYIKEVRRMDDLAGDIAERSANAERNKYLVDQYYPKDRDAGKQEDSVTIDVRVWWQSSD